jgi:hypothetical protein
MLLDIQQEYEAITVFKSTVSAPYSCIQEIHTAVIPAPAGTQRGRRR